MNHTQSSHLNESIERCDLMSPYLSSRLNHLCTDEPGLPSLSVSSALWPFTVGFEDAAALSLSWGVLALSSFPLVIYLELGRLCVTGPKARCSVYSGSWLGGEGEQALVRLRCYRRGRGASAVLTERETEREKLTRGPSLPWV